MSVTHAVPVRGDRGSGRRRGLTLLESLMAIAVLVVVVTAVMSAMSAGRAQSEQARRSISAALAAEMLMSRVTGIDPDVFQSQDAWYAHFTDPATAGGWHGHHEVAGAIRAGRAAALPLLPAGYQDVVLRVATDRQMQMVPPPLAIAIAGVEVTVEALDDHNQTLTRLIRFVPLPRSLADAAP
jgi:prepilin-type N-terminal cleavage/methylation domain-containing protein